MSGSELVHVREGLIVPLPALLAVLAIERAGHQIRIDGDDIVIDRGPGAGPIDPGELAALRRWKRHAWLVVRNLLRDDFEQQTEPDPFRPFSRSTS